MKNSLIIGTEYSIDLDNLAIIGKWNHGSDKWYVKLSYKNGLVSDVLFYGCKERDYNYDELTKRWKNYRESL